MMLGWEFPPHISGGLGTACYGLTKGLRRLDAEVLFVLPRAVRADERSHVELISAPRAVAAAGGARLAGASPVGGASSAVANDEGFVLEGVDVALHPYQRPETFFELVSDDGAQVLANATQTEGAVPESRVQDGRQAKPVPPAVRADHYTGDLFSEVQRYTQLVQRIALRETFDVIHAHDWMTFPAGLAAAATSGKPVVVHVHSTEFDRAGERVNRRIYEIERMGVQEADAVVAVSFLTRNILTSRYGVDADRVTVVYNAIDDNGPSGTAEVPDIGRDEKLVLFLGRITWQKGPEYFIAAAKKVIEHMSNVRFIVAGSGDMNRRMIELAAEMGIGDKVLFTGFLRGADVARVFKMADLYVMPSVSEPFGIAPLEAMSHDVPVIISKQSGVSEVLQHVLKVDFWDVNEMANKIIAVLRHPPLQTTLREHGSLEIKRLRWVDSARKCLDVYEHVMGIPQS